MKIAYLSTFYPLRGGIAQFNASLFRELEKEHDVNAYTFKRQYPSILFPGETQYVTSKDIVDKIQSKEILDTINPLSFYKTAKIINKFAPDILIMRYWMSFFAPSLGTVAKKINKKTKIISILDNVISHEKRFFDTVFTKYFLNQNDGFVVMSDSVRNDLFKIDSKEKKILRTEHPLYNHFGDKIKSTVARRNLKIDKKKKTILFFGFIRAYKGLDLLIDAFGQLDDSYQLIIAGECYESFDKYQRLIDNSKLKNNIFVHNSYIRDDEVALYFGAADICVLPYKSATQSGITAISHHFELPLIATNVGGLKETIINDENGLIVNEINATALKITMKKYFDDNLKNKFIKNIQLVKKNKSWSNLSNNIIDFAATL